MRADSALALVGVVTACDRSVEPGDTDSTVAPRLACWGVPAVSVS
jgi:hypothetical protein